MQLLRFNTWLKKSLHERKESQRIDYSKWSGANQYNWTEDDESVVQTNEDVSGSEKKNKILLLKKLLSNFDKYYHYSDDSRAYRKGKEQQDEIEKLVKEIGKDGSKIYKKFFEQVEGKIKDDDKKRTKKEKEEDDELVNVKPKISGKVYK